MDEMFLLYLLRKNKKMIKVKEGFGCIQFSTSGAVRGISFPCKRIELSRVFSIFSDVNMLLELVAPDIMKKDTTYRKSIYFRKICTRK